MAERRFLHGQKITDQDLWEPDIMQELRISVLDVLAERFPQDEDTSEEAHGDWLEDTAWMILNKLFPEEPPGAGPEMGCHNCRIQAELDKPFSDRNGALTFLGYLHNNCLNCAENTARMEHNWEPRPPAEGDRKVG